MQPHTMSKLPPASCFLPPKTEQVPAVPLKTATVRLGGDSFMPIPLMSVPNPHPHETNLARLQAEQNIIGELVLQRVVQPPPRVL